MLASRGLLALALLAGADAYTRSALLRPRAALPTRKSVRLCADSAEDPKKAPEQLALEAERLALQAEKAALEAEQLTLRAEKLKLQVAKRRKETYASGATTPDPVDPIKAAADALMSSTIASASPPPAELSAPPPAPPAVQPAPPPSAFNLSAPFGELGVNGTAPPIKGALQLALETVGFQDTRSLCVSEAQAELIKSEIFDLETFYTMKAEDSVVGTIFRGNLRGEADVVFGKVQARLANASSGLEGVQLLLIEDPLPLTLAQLEENFEKKPVFLALAPEAGQMRQSLGDLFLGFSALLLATFTTLGYALSSFILTDDGKLIEQLQEGSTDPLMMALPIALGLGGLQLLHEAGHALAALASGVKIGLPVPIPSLQLGLYGCVTRLLCFPPSRAAFFDAAAAGPILAAVASLGLYAFGLVLSFDLPPPPAAPGAELYPVLPTALLQSSLLLGSMAQALLPDLANSPTVQLHPLAVVGFTGALLNALQLLPVGRLDGGRMATAALGQGAAGILSGVGLLLLGFQSLVSGDNPVLLYFGLVTIFFQRAADLPAANEYTGVDLPRQIAAAAAFGFMLLTLLPMPVEVTAAMPL